MDEIFKQVTGAVISFIVSFVLGEWIVRKTEGGKSGSPKHLYAMRAAAVVIGLAVFVGWRWGGNSPTAAGAKDTDLPVLQSVQAKPNSVQKGETVTVTVLL